MKKIVIEENSKPKVKLKTLEIKEHNKTKLNTKKLKEI